MKRTLCGIIAIIMMLSTLPFPCLAEDSASEDIVTYYEDGSYTIECIYEMQSRSPGTKTGVKEKTHYSSSGQACWKLVVNGTFTYANGVPICRSSTCSVTIYDSAWYTISKSASKNGASAIAYVTMGQNVLGVTVKEVSTTVTLTCDGNGNLS